MAAGRTDEQKAGMMRDITQALVKNLGVDADAVVIQINEAPLAHKMKGGKTFVERAAAAKKKRFICRPCAYWGPIARLLPTRFRRFGWRASLTRPSCRRRRLASCCAGQA